MLLGGQETALLVSCLCELQKAFRHTSLSSQLLLLILSVYAAFGCCELLFHQVQEVHFLWICFVGISIFAAAVAVQHSPVCNK